MNLGFLKRGPLTGALLVIAVSLPALVACGETSWPAASPNYAFSTDTPVIKAGTQSMIDIRLRRRDGEQPITDAAISEVRLDMSPDGMSGMTAKATPQASPGPGVYRFSATVPMAGRWALKLGAKVPSETDTIWGAVTLTAKK